MKIKTEYIAIVIAIGSLIFTVYQWKVNIDSRKPRVRVANFQPDHIFYSKELDFIRIYPPKRWFIVNVSDIPITVMSMKLFIKVNNKWHEAKSMYRDLNHKLLEDLFPIPIAGHTHTAFAAPKIMTIGSIFFQVDICPNDKERSNLEAKIEVEDHYGNVHKQVLTEKEIRSDKIKDFSWVSGLNYDVNNSKLIEKFIVESADKFTYLIYAKYQTSVSSTLGFPRIHVSAYSKHTPANPVSDRFFIDCIRLKRWKDGKAKERLWGKNNKAAYIRFENKEPKQIELAFDIRGEPITKTVDLPEEFINACNGIIVK